MKHSITYEGQVNIRIKGKTPVTIHNQGTSILFSFLCNILAGISLSDIGRYAPVKMALIHNNNNSINSNTLNTNLEFDTYKDVSLLLSELPIVDRKVNSSTASVYFSSSLYHSQLNASMQVLAQESEECYVLLLDSFNRIIAHAAFDAVQISSVWGDPTGQAIIEWEMFFGNKEALS